MLKACCDCIAAGIRDERDVYGTQLNGHSLRAPLYPETKVESEKMFILPRKLNGGDEINVTGVISSNPQYLSISLMTGSNEPDYRNIAGQFELHFPVNDDNEKILLKTIVDGVIEEYTTNIKPTDLVTDIQSSSPFTMRIVSKAYELEFYMGESYIDKIPLKHNIDNIRFMTMNGDVKKVDRLEFQFV